jgi:glycosyltransferase involved in cell wall biosynthesis
MERLRIAAFGGFRSLPPKEGGGGADKLALELYPRIVKRGHEVIAYGRIYPDEKNIPRFSEFEGVKIISFHTVNKAGFDTLLHSFKATVDIILKNRADIIHLQSGANSIWALLLRLFGKKVIVSQFAMDWKRAIWPWYAKLFYHFSNVLTAYIPNKVIFDNVYTQEYFEKKFHRHFNFVPYGSEVIISNSGSSVFEKIGIEKGKYLLFVGRFIPDKGVHLIVKAFKKIKTEKKLVLVGGSPTPNDYEKEIRNTGDKRIIFPGYIYGDDTNILIKNAFVYIQPSFIEGLSPVILTVMGLGTPLICSDIVENKFITGDNATHFKSGSIDDLSEKINFTLENPEKIMQMAETGKRDILNRFNWENIADQYIKIFNNK